MEQEEAHETIIPRKILFWITIVIAFGLVLLSLLSIYFVFIYPENQVSQLGIANVTEKANFINQTRTTFISFFLLFAQILAGGAVAIGIYFGWGNLKVALATLENNQTKTKDELKIAQDTLEANMKIAQENLKISQEGQITERFTRAIDQLGAVDKDGNPIIEIRLGAIYALEKIADKSEEYFWPIMEILTAYVRKNSPVDMADSQNKVSLDIQAIFTVIGRRNATYRQRESKNLNLRRTYLKDLELTDAHFEKADLSGTNLEGASIKETHLEGAFLSGTNLKSAFITGTHLEGAFLGSAHFKWAKFYFNSLKGADFRAADLIGAYFYSLDELSKVKTLYKAHLEEELEAELRVKGYSHLLDDKPER